MITQNGTQHLPRRNECCSQQGCGENGSDQIFETTAQTPEAFLSPAPTDALREVANGCTTEECTDLGDNNNPGSIL